MEKYLCYAATSPEDIRRGWLSPSPTPLHRCLRIWHGLDVISYKMIQLHSCFLTNQTFVWCCACVRHTEGWCSPVVGCRCFCLLQVDEASSGEEITVTKISLDTFLSSDTTITSDWIKINDRFITIKTISAETVQGSEVRIIFWDRVCPSPVISHIHTESHAQLHQASYYKTQFNCVMLKSSQSVSTMMTSVVHHKCQ